MIQQRRHPRISISTELWLGQDGIFTRSDEKFSDLSISGAFIETHTIYPVGNIINLRFKLPGSNKFVACSAIVRNTRDGKGLGVEFLELSYEDHRQLQALIDNMPAVPSWDYAP